MLQRLYYKFLARALIVTVTVFVYDCPSIIAKQTQSLTDINKYGRITVRKMVGDIKGIIRSVNQSKTDNTRTKKKYGQTMIYETLRIKLKIQQREPH